MPDRGRSILSASAVAVALLTCAWSAAAVSEASPLPVTPTSRSTEAGGAPLLSAAEPSEAADGTVVDLFHQSAGMTMAADVAGVLHVVASAVVQTGGALSVVYARCSDQCARAASWSAVALAAADVGHVPTIALTNDGRPRVAYHVSTGSSPGLHYAECDGECLSAGTWYDVWLADTLSMNPYTRPRLPFAVSASGSAAYAFDDGTGLQLLWCTSSCASSPAWTQTQIAGVSIVPESLAFGPDEGLQLVARQRQADTESLLFLDCPADCASLQSWNGVTGLWHATGEIQAQLTRTTSGGSRIAAYADDPSTQATEPVFGYLACDADCATPSQWQPPLLPPIAASSADVGYAVALDAADNPLLAFAAIATSAISHCVADCTTSAARWETTPGLTSQDLDADFPITLPPSCEWAGWSIFSGPALALVDGRPVIGLTASAKAYEGPCELGTTLDTVSFVSFQR